MIKFILKFLIICFFSINISYANNEHFESVEEFEKLINRPLYLLDNIQLEQVSTSYLKKNNIKAILIYDEISKTKKPFFNIWKENEKILKSFNQKVDLEINLKNTKKYSTSIRHPKSNRIIGLVEVYFYEVNKDIFLTKAEKEYLLRKRVLKVHNEKNWPPYNFNRDGVPLGLSIDYMNLIAKKLNLDVEYVFGPTWNEFLEKLRNNEIDVMLNIKNTSKRRNYLAFTDSYSIAFNSIYVKEGSTKFNSLDDLKDKKVGVPNGFFAQEYLTTNYPYIQIQLYTDLVETLRALNNGEVDAVIGQRDVIEFLKIEKDFNEIEESSFLDMKINSFLSMATNKDEKILKNIIQKAKNSITENEYLEIKTKWITTNEHVLYSLFDRRQLAYLKKKKRLNYCIQPDKMPIDGMIEKRHIGVMSDILEQIQARLPINIKVIDNKNDIDLMNKIKLNQCDLVLNILSNYGNEKFFNIKRSILEQHFVFITSNDTSFIEDMSSVKNKEFIVTSYDYYNKLKKEYPFLKINLIEDIKDALTLVKDGKYFALIDTSLNARYVIQKYAFNHLKIAGRLDKELLVQTYLSVNSEDLNLISIIDKVVKDISSKQFMNIKDRWSLVKYEKSFDYEVLWKGLGVFALLFLIGAIWLSKLKKEVRLRKETQDKLKKLNDSLEIRIKEELEKNQEQQYIMFQQSRLAQMGEMISMIAHQWRQPLSAISATSEGLKLRVQLDNFDKKVYEDNLSKISDLTLILSSTINDFRNFFKPNKIKNKISYCTAINDSLKIVNSLLESNNIKLIKNLNYKDEIYVYENELKQVIVNLINNSQDAIIEKKIDNGFIQISTYEDEKYAIIEINDNATGIPEDVIKSIFDPYFSTKKTKDGTGLGLYMSKIIIEDHCNGELLVSNNDFGALFTIKILKEEKVD